jgi:hypothetical protein
MPCHVGRGFPFTVSEKFAPPAPGLVMTEAGSRPLRHEKIPALAAVARGPFLHDASGLNVAFDRTAKAWLAGCGAVAQRRAVPGHQEHRASTCRTERPMSTRGYPRRLFRLARRNRSGSAHFEP